MSVDSRGGLAERMASRSPDTRLLETRRERYDRATADLDPPLAVVDLAAFDRNATDLTRRAAGHPIRVATKSLRCRYLIERALATPGYRGLMCYTLSEALWLHAMGTSDDLLVAYPTVDRKALRALAADDRARRNITLMTDSEAHLDVVGRALGDGHPQIRVCLDLDVSWRPLARRPAVHIGTWRSPLHTPDQAIATLFSGGYVASGPGTPDRLPRPYLPAGLSLIGTEGAGEVQTPVRGPAAGPLRPGDRVWLRHAKAGEPAERFLTYHVIHDDGQVTRVPTYRGEGQCFG